MANEKRLIDANALIDDWNKAIKRMVRDSDGKVPVDFGLVIREISKAPTVDAVPVEQYEALIEKYHELRENFIDYVCSGTCNVAPYCLNRCEGCVDRVGWCSQGSDECHGFNPAEVILDCAKMDGDGNED